MTLSKVGQGYSISNFSVLNIHLISKVTKLISNSIFVLRCVKSSICLFLDELVFFLELASQFINLKWMLRNCLLVIGGTKKFFMFYV